MNNNLKAEATCSCCGSHYPRCQSVGDTSIGKRQCHGKRGHGPHHHYVYDDLGRSVEWYDASPEGIRR